MKMLLSDSFQRGFARLRFTFSLLNKQIVLQHFKDQHFKQSYLHLIKISETLYNKTFFFFIKAPEAKTYRKNNNIKEKEEESVFRLQLHINMFCQIFCPTL